MNSQEFKFNVLLKDKNILNITSEEILETIYGKNYNISRHDQMGEFIDFFSEDKLDISYEIFYKNHNRAYDDKIDGLRNDGIILDIYYLCIKCKKIIQIPTSVYWKTKCNCGLFKAYGDY